MRAHRVRVHVPENHELRLQLPSDFPPGEAEVIVLEAAEKVEKVGAKSSIDALIVHRLKRLPGVDPVSIEAMERAISEGAAGRGGS